MIFILFFALFSWSAENVKVIDELASLTGSYRTSLISDNKTGHEFCEPELTQVEWVKEGSNTSLVLTANWVLSNLNMPSFDRKTEQGCTYKVTNSLTSKKIEQVWFQKCKNKKKDFKKVHQVEVTNNGFVYTFIQSDVTLKCEFKKVVGGNK